MSHCPADPLERALVGQDSWFLQQTQKQRVKVSGGGREFGGCFGGGTAQQTPHCGCPPLPQRPPRLQQKPSQLPAVEVIAPGGSYNPTFEDHQVWGGGGLLWGGGSPPEWGVMGCVIRPPPHPCRHCC